MATLALSLSLCGCGSGATPTTSSGEVRVVVDVEGTDVSVPAKPQRVVALSEPTLDGVLALGVTPVGAVAGRGQSTAPGYLGDQVADVPLLGGIAQPDFEAIAAAKPDLILVDGTSINNNPEAMSILRRIAPTVYTGYAGGDWRANFGLVADALGVPERAAEVLTSYDEAVARARKELAPYDDQTFSVVRWQGSSASLILKELPAGMALEDLGLSRPPAQDRRGRGHSDPVSLENLGTIDADYLFFGTLGGSSVGNADSGGGTDTAAAQRALDAAENVPGFGALNAVRDDHVILVDGSIWTSTGGPILMQRIVDSVVEALA